MSVAFIQSASEDACPLPHTDAHTHKLPSHLTSARASALCAWVGRVAGYHGLRSQRRYSAFYECHGRKGSSSRLVHDGMRGRHKVQYLVPYNQQVQSARSDRATGPPVRVLSSGWRKGAGEAMYGSLRCLCLSSQVGRTDPTQR